MLLATRVVPWDWQVTAGWPQPATSRSGLPSPMTSYSEHGVGPPCFRNVWMVTALRNVHRSTMKTRPAIKQSPAEGSKG
jgi:hypothetical protein